MLKICPFYKAIFAICGQLRTLKPRRDGGGSPPNPLYPCAYPGAESELTRTTADELELDQTAAYPLVASAKRGRTLVASARVSQFPRTCFEHFCTYGALTSSTLWTRRNLSH